MATRAIGGGGTPLRGLSVQTASGDCSRTARHLFAPSELSDQPRIDTHPVYHPGRHSHDRIFWSCSSFRSRAPGTRHPPRDDLLDNPRPYHPVHLLEKGNLVHARFRWGMLTASGGRRSEEHTSELQSHSDLVCRLLLEKKKSASNRNPLTPSLITSGIPTIQL